MKDNARLIHIPVSGMVSFRDCTKRTATKLHPLGEYANCPATCPTHLSLKPVDAAGCGQGRTSRKVATSPCRRRFRTQ